MSNAVASASTPGAVPPGTPPGLKPWKPGQSGNPSGRSKQIAEIETLARSHSKEAVEKLVAIMRGKNVKEARLAAEAILDRGLGKPAVAVNLTARSVGDGSAFAGAARSMLEAAVAAAERPGVAATDRQPVALGEAGASVRNDSAVIDVASEPAAAARGQAVAESTDEGGSQ